VGLLVAFMASCGTFALLLWTYFKAQSQSGTSAAMASGVLESLQRALVAEVTLSALVSVLLLFSTVSVLSLGRRWFSNQRTLLQIKMMAYDILASMDRGVVTTNSDGRITSINSAAIHLLGLEFDCVGRTFVSVVPEDSQLAELCNDILQRCSKVRGHDFPVKQAGRLLRVQADGHTLLDQSGNALGCVIHLRDITDRTLLEEQMARMERFVNLATLASGLHHEIKNPLTALSIHVQLLEERFLGGEPLESAHDIVRVLKTEVCRLNGVLETFRSFANLQRLIIQPTEVAAIIAEVVRLIGPQAADQKIEISVSDTVEPIPRVPLDPDKFEQALLNLVINGIEAMPDGGVLTIATAVRDGELRVTVENNGPEIPWEVRPNLFRPYYSTKAAGSGMGLALSEKLIGQHGGRIDYKSSADATAFCIVVPLEQVNVAL
jgi:PAS domain S-box-containing protein